MRMKAFRIDEQTISEMEKVRDPQRFPTQSDFVRAAIKRLIRDERHRLIRAQIQQEMRDTETEAKDHAVASSQVEEWFKRLDQADRGEL